MILLRRFGVSLFTYIFSVSFSGRLDPSGKLMNFQPPPEPRLPCGPSFSTMYAHPSSGRRLLYLWHFTSPATCKTMKHEADDHCYRQTVPFPMSIKLFLCTNSSAPQQSNLASHYHGFLQVTTTRLHGFVLDHRRNNKTAQPYSFLLSI